MDWKILLFIVFCFARVDGFILGKHSINTKVALTVPCCDITTVTMIAFANWFGLVSVVCCRMGYHIIYESISIQSQLID
jgi:hypothetical protein